MVLNIQALRFPNNKGNIILWNTTIKEDKVIPVPQCLPPKAMASAIFGFGFDSTTKGYKVVRVSELPSEGVGVAQVYNLSTNSWRIVAVVVPVPKVAIHIQNCGSYGNGVYYWYVYASSVMKRDFILSFDFSTEVFGRIELPLIRFDSFLGGKVFVLDECLAVLEHNSKTHESNIWVMNDASWTNKFEIRPVPKFASVLGSWGNNEILIEEHGHQIEDRGHLISYNLQNHHMHRFEAHSGGIYVFDYVESLVPLVERRKHFKIGSR